MTAFIRCPLAVACPVRAVLRRARPAHHRDHRRRRQPHPHRHRRLRRRAGRRRAPSSMVVRADLERSGLFRLVEAGTPLAENAAVNFADWKSRGADALVVGSVAAGRQRPLRGALPPARRAEAGLARRPGLRHDGAAGAHHRPPHRRFRLREAARRAGHLLDPHRLRRQEHRPLRAADRRRRRHERADGAGLARADHLAGLVARRHPPRLRLLRSEEAGGLRAFPRHRPPPCRRQLQGLQLGAGLVARRQASSRWC